MAGIKNFLLVFDHSKDELLEELDFGEELELATEAYSRLERQYAHDRAIDVVLVGSDSIETVKVTHANYFPGSSQRLMHDALNLYAS